MKTGSDIPLQRVGRLFGMMTEFEAGPKQSMADLAARLGISSSQFPKDRRLLKEPGSLIAEGFHNPQ